MILQMQKMAINFFVSSLHRHNTAIQTCVSNFILAIICTKKGKNCFQGVGCG